MMQGGNWNARSSNERMGQPQGRGEEREVGGPYWEKTVEEKGIKVKTNSWSDNTGHMLAWWEFDTIEDFAKIWEDERFQQMWAEWAYLADNVRHRLLRPSFTIPEDLKAKWESKIK